MKHFLIEIATGLALCALSVAQNTMPPQGGNQPQTQQNPTSNPTTQTSSQTNPSQPGTSLRIAPGSVIPVQLTKTIDAKKAKTGEQVEARVTQDMKTGNGEVLLPKDTKVIGHITEDQPRAKGEKESHIAIAFDRVVTKDGTDSTLPMSIQAIGSPPGSTRRQQWRE